MSEEIKIPEDIQKLIYELWPGDDIDSPYEKRDIAREFYRHLSPTISKLQDELKEKELLIKAVTDTVEFADKELKKRDEEVMEYRAELLKTIDHLHEHGYSIEADYINQLLNKHK